MNMMILRPFNPSDASTILSWCKDEHTFRLWSADRYKEFPARPEEMLLQYMDDNKYPLTAVIGDAIIGHILLRYPTDDKTLVRFGFVIVDDTKRGKGYGQQMLRLAIEYAHRELGARRITLGVFCDNLSALECYKSVGFRIIGEDSYLIDGKEWKGYEMVLT
jgi:RimJ/RimL family protein N-acetyltransferase